MKFLKQPMGGSISFRLTADHQQRLNDLKTKMLYPPTISEVIRRGVELAIAELEVELRKLT